MDELLSPCTMSYKMDLLFSADLAEDLSNAYSLIESSSLSKNGWE